MRLEHEQKKLEQRSLADVNKLESVHEELEDLKHSDGMRSQRSVRSSRAKVYSQIRQDANAWNMPDVEGDADMIDNLR